MKEHEKKAYLIAQGCNAVDKYGVPEPETLAAMQSYSDQQNAELTRSINQLQRLLDSQMTINDELRERVKELEGVMQEFVDRVDRGEVRSKKTYAKFKEALK